MGAKHTSGPWEEIMVTCGDGSRAPAIKSTPMGAVVAYPMGPTADQISGNSALIAMAPQMLEACKLMLATAFERKWDGDERAYNLLSRTRTLR